jgi:hypothetical protein
MVCDEAYGCTARRGSTGRLANLRVSISTFIIIISRPSDHPLRIRMPVVHVVAQCSVSHDDMDVFDDHSRRDGVANTWSGLPSAGVLDY